MVRDLTSEQRAELDESLFAPIDPRLVAAARNLELELGGAA